MIHPLYVPTNFSSLRGAFHAEGQLQKQAGCPSIFILLCSLLLLLQYTYCKSFVFPLGSGIWVTVKSYSCIIFIFIILVGSLEASGEGGIGVANYDELEDVLEIEKLLTQGETAGISATANGCSNVPSVSANHCYRTRLFAHFKLVPPHIFNK